MNRNDPADNQQGVPTGTTPPTDNQQTPAQEGGNPDAGKEAEAKAQRYLEQLHGREEQLKKVEARLIDHETDRVEKDNAYFLSLMEEDPALAEKVAKQFGKASAKEAAEAVRAAMQGGGNNHQMDKPAIDEEELFRKWEEKREMRDAEKEARALFEELSAESKDIAVKRFEKLIEGKKLSKAEMKEVAEMAVLYANKDALLGSAKDKALAALASSGLHKPSVDAGTKNGKSAVSGADDLAKSMGLGWLYADKK